MARALLASTALAAPAEPSGPAARLLAPLLAGGLCFALLLAVLAVCLGHAKKPRKRDGVRKSTASRPTNGGNGSAQSPAVSSDGTGTGGQRPQHATPKPALLRLPAEYAHPYKKDARDRPEGAVGNEMYPRRALQLVRQTSAPRDRGRGSANPAASELPKYPSEQPGTTLGMSVDCTITEPLVGGEGNARLDLMATGSSAAETATLLRQICDRMGGVVQPAASGGARSTAFELTMDRATIRSGIHAAVAECTTRFRTARTVAFFPNQERKRKQLKMCSRSGMQDFVPVVHDAADEERITDPETGCSALLPAYLVLDRCVTLDEALAACTSQRDRLQELFTIAQYLTKQLITVHRRHIVLRDICRANIVRTKMGAQHGWTLLEYGSVTKSAKASDSVPLRMTPPELAKARIDAEQLVIQESFDMWALGMALWEVCADVEYWPASMTEQQVLWTLATASEPLPHEARPAPVELVQRIVSKLLTRDPAERYTSLQLKHRLDEEEQTGTLAATINSGNRAQRAADVDLAT